ncbi:hypothetical protein PEPNEM18_00601 [Aedoeadaptatus nemausensis]|uniref:Uncharacterized protein n=1 Tax=Aedoeadaptatus nemausensis TaxID=2582829 RepID=A0A6V6Y0C0_9FIRM|nr:zinc-ribbon domain-containing protein [Peptoniphilus nemausensis]CAC9925753.1 hypothetical protein PEPNEM18_00601 [Peptoniphilus nemausensis]
MYCFQCGEELVKGAKFCHVCGANQEEAKKLFEKNFKNSSPDLSFESSKGSSGDTKVAYSSDPEDGEYLKSYMNKVDTQVGESIKKHETLTGIKKQEAKDKKNEEKIEAKKQKKSLKNKETIEPRDAFEPKPVKEPKKKSFSSIWKNFIDEEDNPYSVFGEMADRLEHEEAALSSDEEDNLRISQDVEDDRFAQTGDVSTLNKKVNEILDAQEENEGKEKITPKGVLSSFFSRDKKEDDTIAHEAFIASTEKETPETEDEELHSKSNDSDYMVIDFTRSSEGDDVIVPQDAHESALQSMETTSELEEKPKASRSSFFENFKRKSENLKKAKPEKKKTTTKEESPKHSEKHRAHSLDELLEKTDAASKFEMARKRVLSKGEQGLRGLFGIGILLSALPVFFAFRRIGILPVLFVLLKIFITLFTFYFANNVARRNTCRQDNLKARTVDNLLMWVLYLIPVTVIFFILPSSFAMGRTVLGSVTPHILLSIFMYAWVIFLALSAAREILPKKSTFEFMAWYGIIFISFDLLAKLFWIIMNILTSTFA